MTHTRFALLLGLSLAVGEASGCAPTPPTTQPPVSAPPSEVETPTRPAQTATSDAAKDATSAFAPAETAEAALPSERSPRCFARCMTQGKDDKKSMCRFCRSHQIGVPAEHFEEADRACSKTCEQEWNACFDPCEANEKAVKLRQ